MPVHTEKKSQAGAEHTAVRIVHPRSVDGFCERHGISRATFYNLVKRGAAPDVLRIGASVRIPEHAEAEWLRRNTVPAQAA